MERKFRMHKVCMTKIKIPIDNDPNWFEYWCFGLRAMFRFIALSILISLIILGLRKIYLISIKTLDTIMPNKLSITILVCITIVILPYFFALFSIITGMLCDSDVYIESTNNTTEDNSQNTT